MHGFSVLLSLWERGIATIPEWLPRPHTQRPWRNVEGHFSLCCFEKVQKFGWKEEMITLINEHDL